MIEKYFKLDPKIEREKRKFLAKVYRKIWREARYEAVTAIKKHLKRTKFIVMESRIENDLEKFNQLIYPKLGANGFSLYPRVAMLSEMRNEMMENEFTTDLDISVVKKSEENDSFIDGDEIDDIRSLVYSEEQLTVFSGKVKSSTSHLTSKSEKLLLPSEQVSQNVDKSVLDQDEIEERIVDSIQKIENVMKIELDRLLSKINSQQKDELHL